MALLRALLAFSALAASTSSNDPPSPSGALTPHQNVTYFDSVMTVPPHPTPAHHAPAAT